MGFSKRRNREALDDESVQDDAKHRKQKKPKLALAKEQREDRTKNKKKESQRGVTGKGCGSAVSAAGAGGRSKKARLPSLRDLLGHFSQVVPAEKQTRGCLSTPKALPRLFRSHELWTYPDTQLDSLNPGWEPTVHVFRLPPKLAAKLNPKVAATALELESSTDGLKVSNLGGFHSDQHLFETPDKALRLLHDIASAAVRCAEKEEFGRPSSKDDSAPTHSWVNVSRAGNCNGLHDHSGATWSGCYYVSCRQSQPSPETSDHPGSDAPGSGDFVFRTAVGGLDQGVMARALEGHGGAGLEVTAGDGDKQGEAVQGWCRYGSVRPEEGMLLLFPAWLLHCVMPLSLEGGEKGATRISVAFNVGHQDEG